jgi:hypothetical protein
MTTHTTGTVIDGQLQLDHPLTLPNESRVAVTVQPAADIPADWQERFSKGLEAMQKLKAEHPIGSGGLRLTREELHERR